MRNIFTIGETVYDIIFKQGKPVEAKAGGAMLNTSVSLGKVGLPVHFISEYAADPVGKTINQFLNENKVDTDFINQFEGQTSLALAFLDENNNAEYVFYKNYPEERLTKKFPVIKENDIVLFGSFFSITKDIRDKMKEFLQYAHNAKAIIIYDPNFRKSHLKDLENVKPFIFENIEFADIVRGSDEDFSLIFNTSSAEKSFAKINKLGCSTLVYTTKEKVFLQTNTLKIELNVPEIKTVSTIGAGDNFNAGLIYFFYKNKFLKNDLQTIDKSQWTEMLLSSIYFALEVCMSYENYISEEFAKKYLL